LRRILSAGLPNLGGRDGLLLRDTHVAAELAVAAVVCVLVPDVTFRDGVTAAAFVDDVNARACCWDRAFLSAPWAGRERSIRTKGVSPDGERN